MRLLLVPQGLWPRTGGAEVHAWRLAVALAARGHEVHVLVANVEDVWEDPKQRVQPEAGLPEEAVVDGVHVHRLRHDSFYGKVYRSPLVGVLPGRRWWKKGARRRAMKGYRAALVRLLDRLAPDGVLAMAHQRAAVRTAFDVRRNRPFPLAYVPLLHWLDGDVWEPRTRHFAQAADVVVANTEAERAFLEREFLVEPERIVVAGLGAREPLPPVQPALGNDVLYLGRLDPGKRIDLLLAAMQHVWAAEPERRLVLAGARWPWTRLVDAALDQLRPADRARVDVVADVPEEAKDALFARAGCLALASISESFGLVLLEAWARGVPPVVQDMPVFREVVGDAGWLAPFGSPAAMGEALLHALRDPAEARRRALRGRARTVAERRWDDVASRYEEAFRHAAAHLRPDVDVRLSPR